jgi:hypothetical protein
MARGLAADRDEFLRQHQSARWRDTPVQDADLSRECQAKHAQQDQAYPEQNLGSNEKTHRAGCSFGERLLIWSNAA